MILSTLADDTENRNKNLDSSNQTFTVTFNQVSSDITNEIENLAANRIQSDESVATKREEEDIVISVGPKRKEPC